MEAVNPKKSKKVEDYEIENWADTLIRAEEIKNDPEKMKYVDKFLKKKKKAINSIADIRARYNEMSDEA